ncbi:MAG TPA: type II toxin-antitoxin system HicB family antitoxin [Candidatus Avalokitesvara rifleensis]|uniref:type II toxin-antitoxin system HicB family antitoxin n=1 Tax=Candidatus Avalokitesvara rifleensis TaxID=3367620 RepID=UPI0027130B68|nr:type II toxin-antitoxin system HicB family antitoxin [Candidatus Brocadiales bacterium]
MKELTYTVILEKEEDGGYHAFCPVLKGCHSQGDTYEEALANIQDAIKLYLESLKAHNEEIPLEDITIKPVKVAL